MKYHREKTAFMPVAVIVIAGFFLVCLTSKLWLGNKDSMGEPSALGTGITTGSTCTTLYRWDYAPEQNLMEVELTVENKVLITDRTYSFRAVSRNNRTFDINIVVSDGAFVVLQIIDLPKRWGELKIDILENGKNIGKFYTNDISINRVDMIATLSDTEYLINHYQGLILSYREQIRENEESIRSDEADIEKYRQMAVLAVDDQQYETEKEQAESDARITGYENSIVGLEEHISESEKSISELEERIVNAEKRIDSLTN